MDNTASNPVSYYPPERMFPVATEARFENRRWSAQIPGIASPVEAGSLSELKRLIRATTATHQQVDPAHISVQLDCRMPCDYAAQWAHAQHQDQIARAAANDAATVRRAVIRDRATDCDSGPDIATLLRLSPGRIYQLLKDTSTQIAPGNTTAQASPGR